MMDKSKLAKEIQRREEVNSFAPFPIYDTEVIQDLKILDKMKQKPNYDAEKIDYCATCLSIHLKDIEIPTSVSNENITYCIPCGNTDIRTAQNIHEWEDLYSERYGEKFLKDKE